MQNLIAMYIAMQSKMQSMLKNEKGATMVEYALMVTLIAVACIGTVTALGLAADGKFNEVVTAL